MRIFKKVLFGIVSLVAVLVVVAFFLPSHYKVERSIEIAASPEKIYQYIESPRAWPQWTVWNQRDPNMQITYLGPEKGEGAKWSWKSQTEGSGGMDFIKADAPRSLDYKLSFPEFNMTSSGRLALTPVGTVTKVTWTNEGDVGLNPVMRYFSLGMDSLVGGDFEAGLTNLKTLAEK